MKKRRADELLKEQMSLQSIDLARALIMEGRVMAGDRKILRASEMLPGEVQLRVRGELDKYVSRGAHKLAEAISKFDIDLNGQVCMDVGSSTGGFTDVMLRNGASRVYSIDVGYNLLDYRLRSDPRVVCMERTNARFIQPEDFDPAPVFGATDVSFISIRAILPAVFRVLGRDGRFVALVKPQFEAPQADVERGGIVRRPEVHEKVLKDIEAFVPTLGWRVNGLAVSPIQGHDGNIEFLMDMVSSENVNVKIRNYSISETILNAYDKFMNSSGFGL